MYGTHSEVISLASRHCTISVLIVPEDHFDQFSNIIYKFTVLGVDANTPLTIHL